MGYNIVLSSLVNIQYQWIDLYHHSTENVLHILILLCMNTYQCNTFKNYYFNYKKYFSGNTSTLSYSFSAEKLKL